MTRNLAPHVRDVLRAPALKCTFLHRLAVPLGSVLYLALQQNYRCPDRNLENVS